MKESTVSYSAHLNYKPTIFLFEIFCRAAINMKNLSRKLVPTISSFLTGFAFSMPDRIPAAFHLQISVFY